MLIVSPSISEGLLRRYRLRFRWSMRTLLTAIAALCAWSTAALNRAAVHDPLMAEISGSGGEAWLARSEIKTRLRGLKAAGLAAAKIADHRHDEGFTPAKGARITPQIVRVWLSEFRL